MNRRTYAKSALAAPIAAACTPAHAGYLLQPGSAASEYWPLYCQILAEAERAGDEMDRLCKSSGPDFDGVAFERNNIEPIWARRRACVERIMSAPVASDRDVIAKAYLIAEDMSDGLIDRKRGKAVLAECLTVLDAVR